MSIDNYNIRVEECDYDGCQKDIAVCACCIDKNNFDCYFKCDICGNVYCLDHDYYSYCICPQSQSWNNVCRDCLSKDRYFRETMLKDPNIKITVNVISRDDDSLGMYLCRNFPTCNGLVDIDDYRNYENKCNKCK